MAKNMPKIADISIFCHFEALYGHINITELFFLVQEVLSFDLVGRM